MEEMKVNTEMITLAKETTTVDAFVDAVHNRLPKLPLIDQMTYMMVVLKQEQFQDNQATIDWSVKHADTILSDEMAPIVKNLHKTIFDEKMDQ